MLRLADIEGQFFSVNRHADKGNGTKEMPVAAKPMRWT